MYDVYFGGKRMTKRLTIALVALVALLLVAVLPVSATTFYTVNNTISRGATVYIGEQQLDITPIYNDANSFGETTAGFWLSGNDLSTSGPTYTANLANNPTSFSVDQGTFASGIGNWYLVNGTHANTTYGVVFKVADPSIVADVWDFNTSQLVTGKSVIQGDYLGVRINTNLNEVYLSRTNVDNNVTNGNMDIKVKSESGNIYNKLYSANNIAGVVLTNATVNRSTWYLGTGNNDAPSASNPMTTAWYTGALDSNGQNAYPAGVYSVYAESRVNGMKDFYQNNGADYTGKTVSAIGQVTIASNTVKIEANKDSVVRSKPFSVTITGKPNAQYCLWIKGVSTMSNTYDNQPPMITANQVGVYNDTPSAFAAIYPALDNSIYVGGYQYQNKGSTTNLYQNEGGQNSYDSAAFVTQLYANVTLSDAGKRTVQFTTTNWTKAQKYTIRVEQDFGGAVGFKSDEVDVKVEKGAVTIVAAGDQSYYLGEEVKFSGTNTESSTTYLFIIGPNLDQYGAQIQNEDPRNNAVVDNNVATFQAADVLGDNTWSWKWGTANYALDAGTYTVYAVSQPRDARSEHLSQCAYGTVSIIVKKPFVSATASQSTVAKGDAVFITGTAEGQPSSGVMIWILGKNYAGLATQSVNSDASFSYEVKKEDTKDLYGGQYFIVVQHPMQNDRYDVKALINGAAVTGMPLGQSGAAVYIADQNTGSFAGQTPEFKLTGAGSLQGSDAAEALIEAINSANVDDTYTKLQILIEEPVITIDTVGDRHVGDKFTITATTNLAVDDEVLFEVYSSSFQPTQKSQSGEFSGASGTVKVTKGDSGLNKLSFDVDASTFKPDEYLVKASAVLQEATGTALFNVLEAQPVTAAPTTIATSAASTTVATTVPPTTVATPTKTPTQPGFGALVALIGLGAVALLVVRRH